MREAQEEILNPYEKKKEGERARLGKGVRADGVRGDCRVFEPWLSQQNNPNVLFLTFEDMVEDLPREIKRIGQFLDIQLEQDRIQDIASSGSFTVMKEAKKFDYNWITGGESNFIRKGKVGDWRNYFSEEHSKEIEVLAEKYLKPLGARIRYILPDDNTDKKSLL